MGKNVYACEMWKDNILLQNRAFQSTKRLQSTEMLGHSCLLCIVLDKNEKHELCKLVIQPDPKILPVVLSINDGGTS